ncbi:MAG TPA: glycosyltransferase family 2 protein [Pyrinomonadaceae bacterium]|jgi:cellulose synthase/poly-beta-1,6-N-acetylglucosamine synthase-like glycosyltransferase
MLIFYLFAAILVFLSYKSFRGGINYLKFFQRELAKPKSNFAPFVSVIVPCRGLDEDLEKNLSALFEQDFPAYEILFVTDSEKDEATKIIEKVSRQGAKRAKSKLVVAGKAEDESQKVHNLREAVLRVSGDSEVFVFVDSDARPGKDWLRNLIAPLAGEKIGAATGYRWFISKKIGFASEMRSVWNASVASALGANLKSNFCWGGSMAMRRETFEKLRMREKWRGVLSDDFAVTRALKEANLPIYFVPQALTASVEDCSFRELFEFTTRQIKITRVYAPHLWKQSFTGAFLFNLVFVWGILIIIFSPANTVSFRFALVSLFLISAFSTGKAWLRLKAVKLVLRDYEKDLKRQFRAQNTLWILSPALFLYNSIAALFSRKILWRGIAYELKSPDKTIIIQENTTSY